ncbi:hypothetical protein HPB49_009069 [Dermacentor silvarum]|uniref:Uncharacterized protein n=1 Tax=Dermacentor silvarum TaxID=543639 RepID=A0ACB8C2S9_DERSI|nr:hypothetical protein HPB49_009069 [Dermacentor silvarum]
MMEKSKKTIHRLEMKLSRLKKALQTLQDGYDEARVRLRAYEQDAIAAPRVANRLLCFILRGLSTPHVIPVGYFFTRCLKGEQLSNITAEVMKLTEEAGFRIVRIVTDNHQTNVSLFKSLSDDGTLSHVVTHPMRVGDPLFLSFDQNHLIKNLRKNFLERELLDGDQLIKRGVYMKKLFEIQSQLLVKPVGILHAEKTGNAPSSSESNAVVSLPSQDNDVPSCPVEIKHAARELSGELECVNYWSQAQDELEIAPIAFLAGYLARACDEKV